MRKTKYLAMMLALSLSASMLAGCTFTDTSSDSRTESSKEEKDKDNDKDDDTAEAGYTSSKEVIKTFWKSYDNGDKELMTSCFYPKQRKINEVIDDYFDDALDFEGDIDIKNLVITLEDNDDVDDYASAWGYSGFDAAENYTVVVPFTAKDDNTTYEVESTYDMYTVCYDDSWYVFHMMEIDQVVLSWEYDDEVDSNFTVDPIPGDSDTGSNTSNPSIGGNTNVSNGKWIDYNNMTFTVNGKTYILGQSTLQDLIDDGATFKDDSNAGNNIKPNYESESFDLILNSDRMWTASISVGNFTEENKTIAECPICRISFSTRQQFDDTPAMTDNVLGFAFPVTATRSDFLANAGEFTEEKAYPDDDGGPTYYYSKYLQDCTYYYGDYGYELDFKEDILTYINLRYKP